MGACDNNNHTKTTYADTNEVSELSVSVDIHLHNAVGNSSCDLIFRGS